MARPGVRAALVAAALVVAVAGVLLRPGGRVQADRTEHVVWIRPLATVLPGSVVEQSVRAQADGLSEIAVRVGTFGQRDGCAVVLSVTDDADRTVASQRWPCADVGDGSLLALRFAPLPDSAGRAYRLRVAPDPALGGAVTLGAGPAVPGVGPATVDGRSAGLAAEVHTGYGDDAFAAAQVGTLLRRARQYGPWWSQPLPLGVVAVGAGAALVALAATGTAARRRRLGVALVVGFAVAKGVVWSVAVPPFEGPDEPSHFAYSQFMAEDGRVPKRGVGFRGGEQNASLELRVAVAVLHRNATPPGDRPAYGPGSRGPDLATLDADLDRHANGDNTAAGYSPAYYAVPALLELGDAPVTVRLLRMRLFSVALGALTAWGAVLVGRRLFPSYPAAGLALGVAVAAQPMLSQQTATLNNDALIIATGPFCLLAALELARRDRRRGAGALAGAAVGVGLLAKPFAAAWVPVMVTAWAIGRRRGARRLPWWRDALEGAGGALATYGPWLAFATLGGYAGLGLPEAVSAGGGPRAFLAAFTADWFKPLRDTWVSQFWGNFGSADTPLPGWLQGVLLVAVLGWVVLALWWAAGSAGRVTSARRRGGLPVAEADATAAGALCLLAVAVTAAGLVLLQYQNFLRRGAFDLVQGRYALMLVPAVLALPAIALPALWPRARPTAVLVATAGAMVLLNVIALDVVVTRFYL